MSIKKAFADADRLGATIPKPTRDAFAELTALGASLDAFLADLRHDVGGAVLDVLAAGGEPLADAEVQRRALRHLLIPHVSRMRGAYNERVKAFTDEHAASIVASFAEPFDEAAAVIVAAVPILGDVNLEDTSGIAHMGGAAGKAWAEVIVAEDTIKSVLAAWGNVARDAKTIRGPGGGERFRPGLAVGAIADVDVDEYVADRIEQQTIRPFDAARRGWRLRLATPDEYAEWLAAVRAAQQPPPSAAANTSLTSSVAA